MQCPIPAKRRPLRGWCLPRCTAIPTVQEQNAGFDPLMGRHGIGAKGEHAHPIWLGSEPQRYGGGFLGPYVDYYFGVLPKTFPNPLDSRSAATQRIELNPSSILLLLGSSSLPSCIVISHQLLLHEVTIKVISSYYRLHCVIF